MLCSRSLACCWLSLFLPRSTFLLRGGPPHPPPDDPYFPSLPAVHRRPLSCHSTCVRHPAAPQRHPGSGQIIAGTPDEIGADRPKRPGRPLARTLRVPSPEGAKRLWSPRAGTRRPIRHGLISLHRPANQRRPPLCKRDQAGLGASCRRNPTEPRTGNSTAAAGGGQTHDASTLTLDMCPCTQLPSAPRCDFQGSYPRTHSSTPFRRNSALNPPPPGQK